MVVVRSLVLFGLCLLFASSAPSMDRRGGEEECTSVATDPAAGPVLLQARKTRPSGGDKEGVNHSDVAQVYVTHVGWNSPDISVNLTTCRSKWSMYMNEHLLGSPRRVSSLHTASPTYMFMDVETCGESNWPVYGQPSGNYDTSDNRVRKEDPLCDPRDCSKVATFVRTLPGGAAWHPTTQLVLFDGHGGSPQRCFQPSDTRVVVAAMNFEVRTYRPGLDIAMPSQAGKPFAFPQGPPDLLKTCTPRALLVSFSGSMNNHAFRGQLRRLHNGRDIIVAEPYQVERLGFNYSGLMSRSEFSAAPRGTDPQTYRFSEILSAGAIPVVYSDGFILPFSELLDYSDIAVIIPEGQVHKTREILEAIPLRRRCEMRRSALRAYRQHFADVGKVLDTILLILDARAAAR